MANVLPTLNINQPIISDPSQIAISILKFAFWNPGWTSNIIEETLVSMRKLRAQTAQDIPDFPNALGDKLDAAIKRYFPRYRANVTYEETGPNTYKLIISLLDNRNIPIISADDIVVKDGEIMLKSDLETRYIENDGSYTA